MLNVLDLFQGLASFGMVDPGQAASRAVMIFIGLGLIYLGYRQVLDPLIMLPMGVGVLAVNAGTLPMGGGEVGDLFVNPLVSQTNDVVNSLQIYFLQPLYTLAFTNGLIACLVFMGIGVITDIDYLIAQPTLSLLLAVAGEMGTILTLPIAVAFGFTYKQAAAIALVGGADGPMVLYGSLMMAKELFVPITVVAYVYLSVTYALYPYMGKLLIPKAARGTMMSYKDIPTITGHQKFMFSVIACGVLCLLFPVGAPLFASFFLGVIIKEADIGRYRKMLDEVVLSGSSMFLGFTLGTLLNSATVMDSRVLLIMILGFVALTLSGLGGIFGGWVAYLATRGKVNPVLGIASVSCVPTTAKVAQKLAHEADDQCFIIPFAMGPNVAGVITTAIITAIYVALVPNLGG
jgi:oxaloacetate decarboxylase beta subunit